MIYVDPPGITNAAALGRWLQLAVAFAGSQPAKPAANKKAVRRTRSR